ncbi:hypothetical protein BT69DRAFT_1283420, partial [Atractiella rhizophila]
MEPASQWRFVDKTEGGYILEVNEELYFVQEDVMRGVLFALLDQSGLEVLF